MFDDDDDRGDTPAEQPDEPAAEAPEESPVGEGEAPEEAPPAEVEEPPAAEAEEPPAPEAEEPPAAEEEPPAAEEEPPAAEEEPPAAEGAAPPARPKRERKKSDRDEPEVIPGAHLEPDLVLEEEEAAARGLGEQTAAEIQAAEEALAAEDGEPAEPSEAPAEAPASVPTTILDLAADARYQATGKRKRAVARVVLRPGSGNYTINGRQLDEFFPRPVLQKTARGPLETVGQQERMDVVAKIHGGGVSSQAGALRHGIARALVEADPALRGELKRRGFLTRDPRVKERKKAGLKKARKRPQFSKR
jgi:small subunit ribosomal protein S9